MRKHGINNLNTNIFFSGNYSLINLQFVLIDYMAFDKNHMHIHNVENILHMDDIHLYYLDNIHLINILIYHIHSLVEIRH